MSNVATPKDGITYLYIGRTRVEGTESDTGAYCTECLRGTTNFYRVIKTDNGDEVDFGLCLLCAVNTAYADEESCTISMEVENDD